MEQKGLYRWPYLFKPTKNLGIYEMTVLIIRNCHMKGRVDQNQPSYSIILGKRCCHLTYCKLITYAANVQQFKELTATRI